MLGVIGTCRAPASTVGGWMLTGPPQGTRVLLLFPQTLAHHGGVACTTHAGVSPPPSLFKLSSNIRNIKLIVVTMA